MSSAFKIFSTNEKAESNGVWQDFGDFKVCIARSGGGNKRFARVMEAKIKPFLRAVKTETLDPEIANRIMMECFAECVVTGWQCKQPDPSAPEGFVWADVVEVAEGVFEPFTPAAVMKAFKALPNMFLDIQAQAGAFANFRDAVRETNAGN